MENFTMAETKELEAKLSQIETAITTMMAKHTEEVKTLGAASTETKTALDKLGKDFQEANARFLAIEQKLTAPKGGEGNEVKSIGQMMIESDGFKSVKEGGRRSGTVNVGSFHKTAVVNATGQNQPLVPDQRLPGILMPGLRRLTVRDLLPQLRTSSNLIQYTKELLFTNAAASQTGGSPNSGENIAKAESAITFELANAPVQTIAHWIPASRQILDDAPGLAGYIDTRLQYGLKLEEERQLLSGSGSGNDLGGLVTESTAYDTTRTTVASDTFMDVLRHAITQCEASFFECDGIVLNPQDWEAIELTKQSGSGISSGQYIFANPQSVVAPRLWGKPVVATYAMPKSQFLVGAFGMAAAIWDRQDATVEVSREHSDFFIKNMVAILAEERLGLTVYRSTALIYGGFPFGS
jgi:HK97 family phage major capsid protein